MPVQSAVRQTDGRGTAGGQGSVTMWKRKKGEEAIGHAPAAADEDAPVIAVREVTKVFRLYVRQWDRLWVSLGLDR